MATKTRRGPDVRRIGDTGEAARGYGQVIFAADGSKSWPAAAPRRTEFRFDDPIDEQLRFGIAQSRSSSRDLAKAAGLPASLVDRFMRGEDCLTLGQAARIAPFVGLRLEDQSTVEGFIRVWERAGRPVIECPANSLVRRAVARLRRGPARRRPVGVK